MADELDRLVLHGPKRATAGLVASFEADDESLPRAGDRCVVLGGGEPGISRQCAHRSVGGSRDTLAEAARHSVNFEVFTRDGSQVAYARGFRRAHHGRPGRVSPDRPPDGHEGKQVSAAVTSQA